ncbi:hypothetical protein [Williamsia deligens]|uniref:Uncharacterized protein n=1 Tax=Williamsia deligens TaxID=321325 RepID=A0ABW3G192_9NOCA|nr:hypothetical protein [Williamsia deligens]MCP2195055.1 hypothetical protein [Williamsia deligens]
MNQVLDAVGDYWWLVFPFSGTIFGGFRAVGAANQRRADRRQERYRLKQQAKIAAAEAAGKRRVDAEAETRATRRLMTEHDAIDGRWFAYETDVVALLEYPMMTNMREPLTVAFHRARREADSLRPEDPSETVGDHDAQAAYRAAVHEYGVALDAAESEAKRRRRGDFSAEEQSRLVRAQSLLRLAMDSGSTPQERQSAYRRAREELEGLVVLPAVTYAQLERRVAGELER